MASIRNELLRPWRQIMYPSEIVFHKLRGETKQSVYRLLKKRTLGCRFFLMRIVGNDLDGRHRVGQATANLDFILKNEKEFADCEKQWLLNRIVDQRLEASLIEALQRSKKAWIREPFSAEEYSGISFDDTIFPRDFFTSRQFKAQDYPTKLRAVMALCRSKMLYLMNINAARNTAIETGARTADWTIPWDGNCFLTQEAWSELSESVLSNQMFDYHVVPMARVAANEQVFDWELKLKATEEPQLIFSRTATERFDAQIPYARRNKVELLFRLGIYGPAQRLQEDQWDIRPQPRSRQADLFNPRAGWVARLASGNPLLEIGADAANLRHIARMSSSIRFVIETDRALGLPTIDAIYDALNNGANGNGSRGQ